MATTRMDRRSAASRTMAAMLTAAWSSSCVVSFPSPSLAITPEELREKAAAHVFVGTMGHPFVYSEVWTGTRLPLLSLEDAYQDQHLVCLDSAQTKTNRPSCYSWRMARWPDPILRRPAEPVPFSRLGTAELHRACEILKTTALMNGAVGLAAQQCGVNARIIYLQKAPPGLWHDITLINPRIVARSPEVQVKVWHEQCLVLPPSFRATVLRDAWVDVEYDADHFAMNRNHHHDRHRRIIRLTGEAARALQHEYDHDRGILITDHVADLQDLETPLMRLIEAPGHDRRMRLAYDRSVDEETGATAATTATTWPV